jgi:hypothetical protein
LYRGVGQRSGGSRKYFESVNFRPSLLVLLLSLKLGSLCHRLAEQLLLRQAQLLGISGTASQTSSLHHANSAAAAAAAAAAPATAATAGAGATHNVVEGDVSSRPPLALLPFSAIYAGSGFYFESGRSFVEHRVFVFRVKGPAKHFHIINHKIYIINSILHHLRPFV